MKEANQLLSSAHFGQFWDEVTFSPIRLLPLSAGVFWLHCTMKIPVPFPLKGLYLLLFNDILFL